MNPKSDAAATPGGIGGGTQSSGYHTNYSDTAISPVQRVLDRLQGVRQRGARWTALCPAHEDKRPSLSVAEGKNGRVLLRCQSAGCAVETIVAAIGLTMADLFADKPKRSAGSRKVGGGGGHPTQNDCNTATPPASERKESPADAHEELHSPDAEAGNTSKGCTLEEYSEAKRLPIEFLESVGLSQITYNSAPAVRIPYPMPDGTDGPTRYRVAMVGDRFKWKAGARSCLYGLNRLDAARKAGRVVVVEGESDCHTLWYHDIPAIGLPGAGNWTDGRDAAHLDDIPRIFILFEPDNGGYALKRWLAGSSIRGRVLLVNLKEIAGHKDPSSLYLDNPSVFTKRWQAALDAARPWADVEREDAEAAAREAYADAEPLAVQTDILSAFSAAVRTAGLVGEERVAKLLYLALTSRVLDRPVSVAVKGPSSGGKSFTTETVLSFFPESAVYRLSGASALALNFSDEPFAHRFLYFAEAAGMGESDSKLQGMLRTLMSEGRLEYEVTTKRPDGSFGTQRIHKDGPTGFLTTTTADGLHAENETRFFSVRTDDTRVQTGAVIAGIFDERPKDVDRAPWRALQDWIAACEHRVTVPFGPTLASLVRPLGNRLRRDMGALRGLICAHAVLHQRSRERDPEGRVIATIADYAAVHALTVDIVSEGVSATVSDSIRATVEAVTSIVASPAFESGAPVTEVAKRLDIDKSAASRRLTTARRGGYVVNDETRSGVKARYVIGDPLPEDGGVLPLPEEVARAAGVSDVTQPPIAPPLTREAPGTGAHHPEPLQCCTESGDGMYPSPLIEEEWGDVA